MIRLPRLAIGTVQPEADSQPLVWGLLEALQRNGASVQHFRSRTCFAPLDAAATITGAGSRYLDTWLMSPEACGDELFRTAEDKSFAVVEGGFPGAGRSPEVAGGDLHELCRWLDLPQIAVIDVSRWSECSLPRLPENVQGLLLDRVPTRSILFRLQTQLEALYGFPMLGALFEHSIDRGSMEDLAWGTMPSLELCDALGDELSSTLRMAELRRIAESAGPVWHSVSESGDLPSRSVTIAAAYDAAFHCYFPDALEALEAAGARIVDFSPLRDEGLPPETDIVWIGCGHPERFAEELSANQCMLLALRQHVCAGRRLYAEGGGLAYLCEYLEMPGGEFKSMAGVFPAVARRAQHDGLPAAVELNLMHDCWLADCGEVVRGYRNSAWSLEPTGRLANYASSAASELDFVGRHHAIGSRLHLNFAHLPDVLRHLFQPHAPCLGLAPSSTTLRA